MLRETLKAREFIGGGAFDTGVNEFKFYPDGGLVSGYVYSGTYMGFPTGGVSLDYGPSGPEGGTSPTGAIIHDLTGALVATNYSGLIVSEFEPSFLYPCHPYSDYEFRVKTFGVVGQSEFSNPLKLTSGDITAAITGAGYPTGLYDGRSTEWGCGL